MFRGYYAVVQGDGYRDENSGKHGNYWVLADNDLDSREPSNLIKVQPFEINSVSNRTIIFIDFTYNILFNLTHFIKRRIYNYFCHHFITFFAIFPL